MDGASAKINEDNILDNSTLATAVTSQRDITEIDPSRANNGDRNMVRLHGLQIQGSSRNSDIHDTCTIGNTDPCHKLVDNGRCTCSDDCVLLSPAAGDSKKAGCNSAGEDECRICQSRGEEVLISPCKCAGSAKWVHESCLVKWFQISQTSSCELCSRFVVIKKRTKPLQQWRMPHDGLGPCSRVDLWYLFVTIFSVCTILGFGIFQLLVESKEPETTAVFGAIYALCGIMILLRIRYFYVWFTRRSAFWRKWKTENRVWTVAYPGTVLKVNEVATMV